MSSRWTMDDIKEKGLRIHVPEARPVVCAKKEMVPPKNNKTKLDATKFKQITGWKERTNEHGRDAAMLCFGY